MSLSLPAVTTRRWPPLPATTGVLALSLTAGLLVHWAVAVAVLVLGLTVVFRPFDLFLSCLIVVTAATSVSYEGGHLTRELATVTLLLLYAVMCLGAYAAAGLWRMPWGGLATALAVLMLTTGIATANGLLAHNSSKFLALELLPNLTFLIVLMAGGISVTRADRRVTLALLGLAGLYDVMLGFASYAINRQRAGGISFSDVPGLVALILLNLALREERRGVRWGLIALTALMAFHQLISFTRGYWFGLGAGMLFSVALYVGRGPGMGERAARVARMLGAGAAGAAAALAVFGLWLGYGDIFLMVWQRLESSFGVGGSEGTVSNFARVVEHVAALHSIAAAPWFGHGLGYELLVRQPIYGIITSQWYLHESYLLMWLKQGAVGLVALLWLLFSGVRLGVRGARRADPEEAGWNAAAAACTVSASVIALTNFVFATVNTNFFLALMWGIALASQTPRRTGDSA